MTGNPERLARFQREARVLASLNHPSIADIHGLEEDGGQPFLVLELVEGEDLAERVKRGPIPVDEALVIARQVAEALEEAHAKGIVHRDLKPANVKLTRENKVKVLDFGLAKAWVGEPGGGSSSDLSQSPTLAHSGTQAGVILGTAAYMSPEQARGKPADKRADIWGFGVLLFEMLTGQRLFTGETASEVLASVIKDEPGWAKLPSASPPGIRRLLRRCLEKDPRRRLHDIADARIEIEDLTLEAPGETEKPAAARSWLAVWAPWSLVLALALVAAALWRSASTRAPSDTLAQRYELDLPRAAASGGMQALSPDGRLFSYTGVGRDGEWSIYVRPLGEFEPQKVAGTSGGEYPFFSPDSRWLGFHAHGELRKVPVEGGTPTPICQTPEAHGSTWSQQGDIVFGLPYEGLHQVRAEGGEPKRITNPAELGGTAHVWPSFLPDGDSILFTVWRGSEPSQIALHSLRSGKSSILMQGLSPRYLATGHILFWDNGALRAASFDARSGSITSEPIATGIAPAQRFFGYSYYYVANTGHLVYSETEPSRMSSSEVMIVDADGSERPLADAAGLGWVQPQYSPSGSRIAYVSVPRWGIWTYDTRTRRSVPVATDATAISTWPVWSPDEKWIAFVSNRAGGVNYNTFRAAADGSGVVEQLTFEPSRRTIPSSWSVDEVLAVEQGANTQRDILTLSLADGVQRSLQPFLVTDSNERGRMVGRRASHLLPPRRRDVGVPVVSTNDAFEVSEPKLLFRGDYSYGYIDWAFNYGVHPDGKRFLMVRDGPTPKLRVVVNWFEELRAKMRGSRE